MTKKLLFLWALGLQYVVISFSLGINHVAISLLLFHCCYFRGFGFVIFMEPAVVESVIEMKHTLDGREVR